MATDEEVKQLRELPPGAGLAMAMRALSAAVLVAAAETSRPVYVFTPNSPPELRVALTVGADAVITDHVAIAVELRRRLARERGSADDAGGHTTPGRPPPRTLGGTVVIGAVVGGANGFGFARRRSSAQCSAPGRRHQRRDTGGAILGAEIFLPPTRLGHALERVPFLVAFAMKFLVYGSLIVLALAARPGGRLIRAIAAMVLGPDLAQAMYVQRAPRAVLMVSVFLLMGNAIFVLQLGRLLGERTLRDIVFGRYHRSRTEERFFLFVDIAGSTPLAERIGPDAVHRFLGEVFRLASDPIDDHRGEVFQYVGDEIVITWTVAEGRDGRSTCRLLLRDRRGARAGRARVRARVWRRATSPRCAARRPGHHG